MRVWAAFLAAGAAFAPGVAAAACRLALVLALDVSGSVDDREYALQMTGLADALGDAQVQAAMLTSAEAPVVLAVFEWSSSSYQRQIVDWRAVETSADLDAIREVLLTWQRAPAPEATGLGAALLHATGLFRRGPACWQQTLDISADGKNNDWPIPERLREAGRLGEMNVNALVVARDIRADRAIVEDGVAELTAYFRARIIHGPGAFVEVAIGYDDYARAMKRKLLRELETMPLGWIGPADGTNKPVRVSHAPARPSRVSADQ